MMFLPMILALEALPLRLEEAFELDVLGLKA